MRKTSIERFHTLYRKTRSCWIWQGHIDHYGYGIIRHNGKATKAHRLSYMIFVGQIPQGLVIDHLCRNTKCVNPEHLEPKTIAENARRNYQVLKRFCPKRHRYNDKNTYIDPRNSRRCRKCAQLRYQALKAKRLV